MNAGIEQMLEAYAIRDLYDRKNAKCGASIECGFLKEIGAGQTAENDFLHDFLHRIFSII